MKPTTVLVTGAGGAAGISVIKALIRSGHRVVGADSDPLAAGLFVADHAAVLPPFDSPHYLDRLRDAARASQASVLISTLAEEMAHLARAADSLDRAGLRYWLPDPAAVTACVDKWLFAGRLAGSGIPAPVTALGRADGVPGPWIVKPRFGRGSRHVYSVEDRSALAWALARVPDPLVQTRLEGREFTVDCLTDHGGRLIGAVPRWRLETKAGISTKGETFEHAGLVRQTGRLLSHLGLCGPANVQGFIDASGRIWFMEVNPRFSGGLPLSLAAGAELVDVYLDGILGRPMDPDRLRFEPGVVMMRHFQEIYTDRFGASRVAAGR